MFSLVDILKIFPFVSAIGALVILGNNNAEAPTPAVIVGGGGGNAVGKSTNKIYITISTFTLVFPSVLSLVSLGFFSRVPQVPGTFEILSFYIKGLVKTILW